ncbi:periplasmic heavy metal sensor [Nitratidesulfovibrio sp.]|uniref:periplasmic heavy metal sensor n=1 Tax=Nitratidesulfovibrio sp. TaxID=2802297 RepID=UPI00333F6D3C
MKTKHLVLGTVALAGLLAITGITDSAFARMGGMGMGGGCATGAVYNALTPEKQAKFDAVYKEADARIQPLKDKAWAKHTELNALSTNPNTKPETISKLAGELADLRTQIRKEYTALDERLEKEVGVNPGYGRMGHMGMGGGMMGGRGMGHGGGMMGGQGMGHGPMHDGQMPQANQ